MGFAKNYNTVRVTDAKHRKLHRILQFVATLRKSLGKRLVVAVWSCPCPHFLGPAQQEYWGKSQNANANHEVHAA
ncbi:hypothetical protein SESBI_33269 [Sesbania bispinosa]|nr:hypothetical protein SESBI_33269 [Sesbania bispinosa]